MELAEKIETINRQLTDHFSFDSVTGQPIWRVVWSDDQLEKRLGDYEDYTRSGIFVRRVREVREVPKYPWIKAMYVLERLVLVPLQNMDELLGQQVSYEPIWVFHDSKGFPLAPTFWACKFAIDTVYAAQGKSGMAKYVDDEARNPVESRIERINKLQKELFGNETDATDALAYKSGVVVPHNYGEKQ